MTLTVRMDSNGQTIDIIKILTRAPHGPHVEGDGTNDEWLYEWTSVNGGRGSVLHACNDGAHALAAKVLAAHTNIDDLDVEMPDPEFAEAHQQAAATARADRSARGGA